MRDFDLLNAGAFFRVKFEPAEALGANTVIITTVFRTQNDGAFVRLASQEIEEANAAMPQSFSYLKAFVAATSLSTNIRANTDGLLIIADFDTEVAKGTIANHTLFRGFGRNPDVDTGATEAVWAQGGAYTFPAAAQTLDTVSSDANDTAAGTGAQTLLLEGLDASYLEISETITLDGVTPVTSVNSYLRLNRATVKTAGSDGGNAGTITIDQTTSGTVMASFSAGVNQSQLGIYTCAASKIGYMRGIAVGAMKQASAAVDVEVYLRPENEVFQLQGSYGVHTGVGQNWIPFPSPLALPAKSDLRFDTNSTANNVQVTVDFPILIVD